MRRTISILILIASLVVGARIFSWRPLAPTGPAPGDMQRRVSGVLHVHTTFSDGRGTPEEVLDAAKAAGLDYIILTDHNGSDARRAEGYSGKLLVIVGTEISTRSGHLLAFGFPDSPLRFSDDAAEVLDDVDALGGVAMLAHPDSPRQDFRWTGENTPAPWGIEILNGDTQLRSMRWGDALALLAYPLNPTYALLGALSRPDATLDRWDQLLAGRNTPIVAGADAHGFPSYASVFRLAQNHLLLDGPLTGDAVKDTAAVVSALGRGSGHVGIDGLASARGFSFVAQQDGKEWSMGDTVPLAPVSRLRAGGALPPGATVSLLRDGQLVKQGSGPVEWPNAGAGVYRVEVRVPGWDLPWILSNPIYLFDDATHAERLGRARLPAVPVPEKATHMLDDFDSVRAFEAASNPPTAMSREIVAAGEGPDGTAAGRMQFSIGQPTDAVPSPFAALTSLQSRDLSAYRGLVFSIRGDGLYRVWLQVRDANPRSEEGTEWWYASVRASTTWRRVAVPFDRLRTRDAGSDGSLNLAETKGVLFIVDIGAVKPGTRGVIWLDDVGLY
jgi:hypothetical protein